MVPGTSHRVADHQPLRERPAVMRAGGADREEFIPAAREQHGFLAHVPAHHGPVAKGVERHAAHEIGSFRLGLLGSHERAPNTAAWDQSGAPCPAMQRRKVSASANSDERTTNRLGLFQFRRGGAHSPALSTVRLFAHCSVRIEHGERAAQFPLLAVGAGRGKAGEVTLTGLRCFSLRTIGRASSCPVVRPGLKVGHPAVDPRAHSWNARSRRAKS